MRAFIFILLLTSCVSEPSNIVTQPAVIDSVYTERKPTGAPPLFYKDQWHIRANGHWVISHTPRSVGDTIIFYNYGEKH